MGFGIWVSSLAGHGVRMGLGNHPWKKLCPGWGVTAGLWAGLQAVLSHELPSENSSSSGHAEPWQGGTGQELLQQHKGSHLPWDKGAPLLPAEPCCVLLTPTQMAMAAESHTGWGERLQPGRGLRWWEFRKKNQTLQESFWPHKKHATDSRKIFCPCQQFLVGNQE